MLTVPFHEAFFTHPYETEGVLMHAVSVLVGLIIRP